MIDDEFLSKLSKLYEQAFFNILILRSDFYFQNDTEVISSKEENFIKAYIVLSHAEIENLFEQLFLTILEYEFTTWLQNKKAGFILSSLFIWSHDEKRKNFKDVVNRSHHVFSQYKKIIADNHGIKKENIVKLLEPLGISIDILSDFLLNNLTTFALYRNKIAHTNRTQIRKDYNFNDIIILVDSIMYEIKIAINNWIKLYT